MGKLTSSKPNNNDSASSNNTTGPSKHAPEIKDNNTNNDYPTKRQSSKRREINTAVSESMVMVINDAAQTARLVLDKHATEENSSVASYTSFSSTRSVPSERLGGDDGMSLSLGEDDDFANTEMKGVDTTSTTTSGNNLDSMDDSKVDASFVSGSSIDVPGSSPPPLAAFSNLPMSRGFSSSTPHQHTGSKNEDKDGTDGDGVLAEGKVVEVTNHFDAAAAISAALASSHLAQATGGVGELQMSLSQHPYKPALKHRKGFHRRSTSDSSGDNLEMALKLQPLESKHRRCSSEDESVGISRRATVDESAFNRSADKKMKQYKRTSSSDNAYTPTKFSLPTPAEAAAEMKQRRSSYTSYESLDEDERDVVKMVHKTDEGSKAEPVQEADQSSGAKEVAGHRVNKKDKDSNPKEGNVVRSKRISQVSELSDSGSMGSSSGFENESNTSSYGSNTYGSNTFGSTISPITMTGFSSEEGKRNKSSGSNNQGGMLGNLRTTAYKSHPSDNSFDTASCDEEYSMNGRDETGLLGKNSRTTLQQNSSKKSKSVRIASAAEVISSTSNPAYINIETQKASVRFSEEKQHSVPPAIKPSNLPSSADERHLSLFESFDRNWEQAVEGRPNPQLELGLGKKCLASFATLFETKKTIGDKKRTPLFRWWVDDSVLGSGSEEDAFMAKDNDQTENPKIPIDVVRMMWKVCIFESTNNFDSDEAEFLLDSVQQTLVNDLCYLEKIDTSTCSCFRLSLGAYTDYGRYILRRFDLEDQISLWHGKIAYSLRHNLLHSKDSDEDATTIQRYAARSLPRHAAFGILNNVESVSADATAETCEELWKNVFHSLLCNDDFIKARSDLLGRGSARSSIVDVALNNSEAANTQLIESMKQIRDSDVNFAASTTAQLRDIEWCAAICLPNLEGMESTHDESVSSNDRNSGEVPFNSYLSAFVKWRENLSALFCALRDSGKVTVGQESSAMMSLSCNVSSEEAESFSRTDKSADVAQSLLDNGDPWSTKDSSSKISKAGSTKGTVVPRKGRRMRGKNVEEMSAPLAQVLKIDIHDLRSAVSLGRSLLCIYEVLASVDVSSLKLDDAKFASDCLRREQLACVSRAVEIFSCCANTLLHIQSNKLDKLDEEDLDETVVTALGPELCLQNFALVRETSRPLLAVTGILASTAWNYLGKLVGSSYQSQSDPSRHSMLSCLERAALILGSPKSMITDRPQMKTLFAPLAKYKNFLHANINHAVGVELYESGKFEKAAGYLDEASQIRRRLIDDIRGQLEEGNQIFSSKGVNPLSSSPELIPEDVVTNALEYAVGHCCTLLPRKGADKTDADDIELSLSLTLEYSALTHHAIKKYQSALAFFQEALILRTMRVGKHSLDVASLHFNMGVVYDDLSQYDSAISRYHESLRIRLDHLEKDSSLHALEETVLLTLKCMGNVYKVVDDIDDAICCYVKALEMLNRKYARHRNPVDTWSKMGLRLDLAIPVPSVMFNEMKKRQLQTDMSWRHHFQAINKKALCHYFAEETELSPRSSSSISKIKKELVKMHNAVIALVQQKKHADDEQAQKAFANSRSKFGGSSMLLATIPSELQGGSDTFEVALMNSSFGLGKIRLGQTRYEEAADLFEIALRSKWVLDPASSSDSDSEFSLKSRSSRSSRSSRKKQVKSVNEDVPEEGQLYYSLGMANAALDDHDRAVRCFLTALRYLRRSLKMVDSQEVARVLFDCATSYYYICDFDQALSLWGECLRILKIHDEKVPNPSRQGICLYCIVLARCSLEKDDAETFSLLNEAQILLSDCTDKTILAYMEFLTGHFLQRAAAQIPTHCRSRLPTNMRLVPQGSSLEDGMSWKQMCSSALSLFDQVKNECWFDLDDIDEEADEVKNLPLSAHLSLKKGQVYEMIGSTDQALNFYMDAVNFYRIACGHENVYAASVLHCMGMLCASSQKSDDHALTYFNEALTIRRNILGANDSSVAESLYCSASVLARLNRYESSMERYHEALRIQMSAFGQGSKEVAFTLAGMGQCHYSHRAYDLARTCLLGALRVRKHRVSQLSDDHDDYDEDPQSSRDSLYEEEVALGGLFFGLGNINMQLGDHAQAMQYFIESRDMRWRHVGGGSTDKILDRYLAGSSVDEDELLGLAHCLHNIGLLFDMKEEYHRSLPHYDEALKIKNAIAGFNSIESTALLAPASVNPKENVSLVLKSLEEDLELPQVTKATLSVSMTHKKMASIYAKQNKLELALFHYTNALSIQRQVLGRDHFVTAAVLTSMGNVLSRTDNAHSDSAALCYNESLRISRQRFGPNHEKVASALFNIASLYDSSADFDKATHYYNRALSVYKRQYSQELRVRLCSGLLSPISHPGVHVDDAVTEILSNGDEITLNDSSASAKNHLNEQYKRVAYALRRARRRDAIQRGDSSGSGSCIDDDWWLTFEVLVFQFVEMFSSYVIDPANSAVRKTIEGTIESIEAAAAEAIVTAADAVDYSFLLQLQD